MEFLCPNCQKVLTVPEHLAGQPMKCPHCDGTFTAPNLAPARPEVYSVASDPVRPSAPPPPPAQPQTSAADSPPQQRPRPSSSAPPPITPTSGYSQKHVLQLDRRILPYIPVGALVLVFFLTFFPWVGSYPGGIGVLTQNAWQAAFGSVTADTGITTFPVSPEDFHPGVSAWTLLALLTVLVALAIAVALVVMPRTQVKLPPQVQHYWPWRMLILAGVAALPLILLTLQMLVGFALETKASDEAGAAARERRAASKGEPAVRNAEVEEGMAVGRLGLHRTLALRLAYLCLLVAVLTALLEYWLDRRGANRPLPRVELLW
jgi:hypothetical protein